MGAFRFFVILLLALTVESASVSSAGKTVGPKGSAGGEEMIWTVAANRLRNPEMRAGAEEEEIYRRWLSSLRGLRHDFLNDIQVLAGYFQLQKLEEGRRYLAQMYQRLQQESMLIQLDYPPLVVYLMTFNYQQDALRLEVELEEPVMLNNLIVSPREFYQAIKRWLDIYCRHAACSKQDAGLAANPAGNHLLLGMRARAHDVEVTFDFIGRWNADAASADMQRCVVDMMRMDIHCSIDVHTEQESVLKMTVPFHRS